jgi:hypothetical protein
MFWSTKNKTTTYNYPSANVGTNTTVISVGAGGGGASGSSGIVAIPASSITNTATGSSGQYFGSSGWTSVISSGTTSQGTITMTGNLHIDSDNPHINTKKNKIDLDKLCRNLEIVNEMFHIIVPDEHKLEKHPSLKDAFNEYLNCKNIEPRYNSEQYIAAYEQFKLLEALLEEQHEQ